MKKWLITAAVVLALSGLALTSSRWLTPFLAFLGANSTVIQTLGSLIQLALWICAGGVLLVGLWRPNKADAGRAAESKTETNVEATGNNSAAAGRDVRDSNVVSGDDNVVGRVEVGEIVRGNKTVTYIQEVHHQQTANALHQLPSPPRDFTGRAEELDELTRGIERGGATISGLQGQGGVGKTTLALKLAQLLTPRYPDAQFYLDLKGTTQPLSPSDAMAHVIRAYNLTAKLPDKEDELRALYNSVLHEQRALLLMDNARDAAQIEPLIPPDTCVLLVTSRKHFTLPGLLAKDLNKMPPEDARALLTRIAPRINDRADDIARLCGYLPYAMRLAASALSEQRDLSPADYVRRLSDEQQRLKLLDKVEASLSLSYDLLAPDLQKLWRALAVFPATFDAPAAAAVWETEQDAAGDALGELVKYSLLDWDGMTARYSLHDLARLLADKRLSEEEKYAAQARHAAHYLNVLAEANDLYLRGGEAIMQGLGLFDTEWANIQAGQSWAASHADDDTGARLCSYYPDSGMYVLNLRLHPQEQIKWLKEALSAARKSNDRSREGRTLGNLGIAYADIGDTHRAIKFHEQNLVVAREIGDRRGEGSALGNLAATYRRMDETRRSIELSEQVLAIMREIDDRRGEGLAFRNLGNAYVDLGDPRRAIEFFEQDLAIARGISDRHGEGTALGNLGVAYYILGETRRAIEFHEQALEIDRELGDRRGEGSDLGNLGNAYFDLGEARHAIEFYEQLLAIAQEIGDRRGEGSALNNLGLAYDNLGETRRGIEFYKQRLVIAREIGDRRGEGIALWNMSLSLDSLGDRNQAIAHAVAALRILEQIEDPNAARVRNRLAEWRGQTE